MCLQLVLSIPYQPHTSTYIIIIIQVYVEQSEECMGGGQFYLLLWLNRIKYVYSFI